MSVVVYHADDETVYFHNGSLYVAIPPRTPVEIGNDYDARVLLNEKAYHGLVEVTQTKSNMGTRYDVEDADERAEAALSAADEETLRRYVEGQFEDRVKTGRPALPPGKGSRIEKLAEKYQVNFKRDYGLDIISISAAQSKLQAQRQNDVVTQRLEAAEAEAAELRQQNSALAQNLLDLSKKIDELLAKK